MMFVEYGDLIETLRDCAYALDEVLPRNHAYRKIVEQAYRLIDRHDCRTTQDVRADAHLIAACEQGEGRKNASRFNSERNPDVNSKGGNHAELTEGDTHGL